MFEEQIKTGFVTIIGRPNAGKSTLLNNILQQKIAIMSDKPQTTRNIINGVYTDNDSQIVFIDTPGIHKPKHRLGDYMMKLASSAIQESEIVYLIINASEKFGPGDQHLINIVKELKVPTFLLINKIDLISPEQLIQIIEFYKDLYDFIRVGIIIYGGVTPEETIPYNFKPVMSLYAKISYVKKLYADSYVSYDNTYKAKKGDVIATVSIGYADGIRRDLSNKGYVYYKGYKCNIIGRVCMDQLLILLPKELESKAKKGDAVEFFGKNISVVEVANLCNTISYEILCGMSKRVPRVYINR